MGVSGETEAGRKCLWASSRPWELSRTLRLPPPRASVYAAEMGPITGVPSALQGEKQCCPRASYSETLMYSLSLLWILRAVRVPPSVPPLCPFWASTTCPSLPPGPPNPSHCKRPLGPPVFLLLVPQLPAVPPPSHSFEERFGKVDQRLGNGAFPPASVKIQTYHHRRCGPACSSSPATPDSSHTKSTCIGLVNPEHFQLRPLHMLFPLPAMLFPSGLHGAASSSLTPGVT